MLPRYDLPPDFVLTTPPPEPIMPASGPPGVVGRDPGFLSWRRGGSEPPVASPGGRPGSPRSNGVGEHAMRAVSTHPVGPWRHSGCGCRPGSHRRRAPSERLLLPLRFIRKVLLATSHRPRYPKSSWLSRKSPSCPPIHPAAPVCRASAERRNPFSIMPAATSPRRWPSSANTIRIRRISPAIATPCWWLPGNTGIPTGGSCSGPSRRKPGPVEP